MGQRGPKPGTGGRPKKAIADRIAEGNPGRRPLTVIDFGDSAADLEGQEMPKPSEFLSARQKDGSTLCAAEIYENVWKWLAERGCAALVSPQLIDYNDGSPREENPTLNVPLGSRLLKKGMTGTYVTALQELLLQLGYGLPKYGVDGAFGSETEAAVLDFQKDQEILQDGKYGGETHAALMDAVADDDEGRKDEHETDPVPETPVFAGQRVVIVSEGGKVNIRAGNGTQYARLSSVAPGTTFEHIATAENGWYAVLFGNQVGWVSGSFSRIV